MKKIIVSLLAVTFLFSTSFSAPYSDPNKTKMTITVTTSNIGEIVNEIGGDKVDVVIMIKPIICPSNVDITPGMLKRVERSNLILSHNWEKWINKLKLEAGDRGKIYKKVETEGNWMIPYIHIRAAEEIKDILVNLDEENKDYYEERYTSYAYKVDFTASLLKKDMEKAYGVKVIANDKIRDFLESYGFEVIGVYGKAEELTAKRMAFLVKEGKRQKAQIVIDNLQAGASTGRELAKNIEAKHIMISNFILGKSYINTLKDNIERIKKVLE